ncbi:preprotein translocase subunit TatA [Thiomicrospira aerophila AL3]|uniref:Sec-independent protein translocase protein TatA n=1 Tax=Thiomicrospira aerophila AL3 TaxID=717772 RepID=W0DTT4_9GAMM|nr:preprotein translocase subunit TatA [Thiomicrospira aerophila AL3]
MGISIWQLLIILAIVLVIFGAKRLKNVGTDLGSAIKGFKKAVAEDEDKKNTEQAQAKTLADEQKDQNVYDVQATEKENSDTKPKA